MFVPLRLGRVLLTCSVMGFIGMDIVAHGLHDRAAGLTIFGMALLIPSILGMAFATRWVFRFIKGFCQ